MTAAIKLPEADDYRVLRSVRVNGARILTWDTGRRAHDTGHSYIGYAFWPRADAERADAEPLFCGEDLGIPAGERIDADSALASLIGWLVAKSMPA